MKKEYGITLIVLIVTIVVLSILASVSINLLYSQDGLINNSETAVNEYKKQEAIEKMVMKLAEKNIDNYEKLNSIYDLQDLADALCKDDEIESVSLGSTIASLPRINTLNYKTIVVKLKAYSYKFEINRKSKIVSIDGIITNDGNEDLDDSNYKSRLSVTYITNGGSSNVPETWGYKTGESVNVELEGENIPEREGYDFKGWALTSDSTEEQYSLSKEKNFIMGENDVTLYAVWSEKNYTVTATLGNGLTINNNVGSIIHGNSYNATITSDNAHTLDGLTVTMGGTEQTVNLETGVINIAHVTGNIVINATSIEGRPKVYLYNDGEKCINITGGWSLGYLGGTNPSVGSINDKTTYIEMKTWGIWVAYGMVTTNTINFANYSKLFIEASDADIKTISYSGLAVNDKSDNDLNHENKTLYEYTNIKGWGNSKLTVAVQNGSSINIKKIWLEAD